MHYYDIFDFERFLCNLGYNKALINAKNVLTVQKKLSGKKINKVFFYTDLQYYFNATYLYTTNIYNVSCVLYINMTGVASLFPKRS